MESNEGQKSHKRKSVRWPEENRLSVAQGDNDSRRAGPSDSSSQPGNPSITEDEEEDYFNYLGASGNRGSESESASGSYTSEVESDDDDANDNETSSMRAATIENTIRNRDAGHLPQIVNEDDVEHLPPQQAHLRMSDLQVNPLSLMDLGQGASGMTPGAILQDQPDPIEEEYRKKFRALSPQARTSVNRTHHSLPASPLLSPDLLVTGEDGNSIPLKELQRRLEEEIEASANSGDNGRTNKGEGPSTHTPPHRHRSIRIESQKGDGNVEKDEKEKQMDDSSIFSEKNSLTALNDSGPGYDEPANVAKAEANDIAAELVRTHLAKQRLLQGNNQDSGYVHNDNFLTNALSKDDDIARPPELNDNSSFSSKQSSVSSDHNVDESGEYIPRPRRVMEGVLGALLRLNAQADDVRSVRSGVSTPSESNTPIQTPVQSPSETPVQSPYASDAESRKSLLQIRHHPSHLPKIPKLKRPAYFRSMSTEDILGRSKDRRQWYSHSRTSSKTSLFGSYEQEAGAKESLQKKETPAQKKERKEAKKRDEKKRKEEKARAKKLKKARLAEQQRITTHIADVLQRQRFILRLGRALMLFGAPTHRLESYLDVTARVLELDVQFLYIPGCMLVSFNDATTHTSETKLLRVNQGLNLTKIDATHLIYKEVVHDLMSLDEASNRIDELLKSKNLYPPWMCVIIYMVSTGFISLYGYQGYWRDLPIAGVLGGCVAVLQFYVAPRSPLYSNVFEVSSSIVVSFLGRALGSITQHGDYVFCFAAIVQGALALILPGYIILCGALELQSKNLVAGSVRMFYAVIYSMFLSFGITLGSTIYGWFDHNAVSVTTCKRSLDDKWRILAIPIAATGLGMVNQASFRQLPVMIFLASAGYAVLYFVQQRVKSASAFTSAIGAFTIGILGNLYSRIGHGLAFAAMLPAVFVIVPSGVAAQGSLVAGVSLANQIVKNSTITDQKPDDYSPSNLGNAMIQVAVGITVGLFAATLVVYPLGLKSKRSALFTF